MPRDRPSDPTATMGPGEGLPRPIKGHVQSVPLVSVGGQCAVRAVSPGVPLTLAIIQPDTYSSRTDLANAVLTQESTRWSNIHDTMPLMKIRSTAAQQWPGIYREMRIFKEAQGRKVQGAGA